MPGILDRYKKTREETISADQTAEILRMAKEGDLQPVKSKQSSVGRFFLGDKNAAANELITRMALQELGADTAGDRETKRQTKLEKLRDQLEQNRMRLREELGLESKKKEAEIGLDTKKKEKDIDRSDKTIDEVRDAEAMAKAMGESLEGLSDDQKIIAGKALAIRLGAKGAAMGTDEWKQYSKNLPKAYRAEAEQAKTSVAKAQKERTEIALEAPYRPEQIASKAQNEIARNRYDTALAGDLLTNLPEDARVTRGLRSKELERAGDITVPTLRLDSKGGYNSLMPPRVDREQYLESKFFRGQELTPEKMERTREIPGGLMGAIKANPAILQELGILPPPTNTLPVNPWATSLQQAPLGTNTLQSKIRRPLPPYFQFMQGN